LSMFQPGRCDVLVVIGSMITALYIPAVEGIRTVLMQLLSLAENIR
jgi:hypothetical protein